MAFDIDLFNSLAGVVGIIIGILGLLIAYKTKREQWLIAEKSGAFNKPKFSLAAFGQPLRVGYLNNEDWHLIHPLTALRPNAKIQPPKTDNEDWCFIHPGTPDEFGFFPIQFTIINIGDAACEDVTLTIQVPQTCYPVSLVKGSELMAWPSIISDSIKFSADESGSYTLLSFVLPPMKPKMVFNLTVPFFFRATQFPDITNLSKKEITLLKSNKPFDVPFLLMETHIFTIWLRSIASAPIYFQMNIRALSATDIKDGIQKYLKAVSKSTLILTLHNKQFKKSVLGWLRERLMTVEKPKAYNFLAFEVENKNVVETQQNIYFMKLPRNLSYMIYWFRHIFMLEQLKSGTIVSIFEYQSIPKPSRR